MIVGFRATGRGFFGAVGMVVGLWFFPAAAGPVELEFSKGVVAFSRGDLQEAESCLEAALSQQPEHAQATYYLGQVALGLGKLERAVALFRRVIALNPADQAVRLDLAQALVRAERFAEAEGELESASTMLSDRASVQYYLGYCRYRMGNYRQALEPLKRAQELDQGFTTAAGYYLGLSYFCLGEEREAQNLFRQLSTMEGSEQISSFARQNLALLTEGGRRLEGRRWGAFASTGGGYDSNVTLNPTDKSGANTAMAFVSVGGFYLPIKGRQDELLFLVNLYRSFYVSEEARGFNLTDLSTVLRWQHLFESGHRLELAYLFDLDMLDGGGATRELVGMDDFGVYLQGHAGTALFSFQEGPHTRTEVEYRFRTVFFLSSLSERDSLGHELLVRQILTLHGDRLRISALGGMTYQDGRASQWDRWGPFAELECRLRLFDAVSLWVQGAYHRQDHYRSEGVWADGKREDDLFTAGAGLSVRLLNQLALGLSYQYQNNRSLDVFNYHRHLVNLALLGSL